MKIEHEQKLKENNLDIYKKILKQNLFWFVTNYNFIFQDILMNYLLIIIVIK